MNRERFEIVKHPTSGSWHIFRYSGSDFKRVAVVYAEYHAIRFCEAIEPQLECYVRPPDAYPSSES